LGKITAEEITGPANGPLPTSSTPALIFLIIIFYPFNILQKTFLDCPCNRF